MSSLGCLARRIATRGRPRERGGYIPISATLFRRRRTVGFEEHPLYLCRNRFCLEGFRHKFDTSQIAYEQAELTLRELIARDENNRIVFDTVARTASISSTPFIPAIR